MTTTIRTKLRRGQRSLGMTPEVRLHTFVQRDVAMAFLTSLFVRFPRAAGGSIVLDGDVITFVAPDVLE